MLGKDAASSQELQREWVDEGHTEFVCIMDGKLRRFKIITRVYCIQKTGAAQEWDAQEWDDIRRTCVEGLDLAEPEARNIVMVLKAVQHYLLTLPQGAHKEILYQIDDALKLLIKDKS